MYEHTNQLTRTVTNVPANFNQEEDFDINSSASVMSRCVINSFSGSGIDAIFILRLKCTARVGERMVK